MLVTLKVLVVLVRMRWITLCVTIKATFIWLLICGFRASGTNAACNYFPFHGPVGGSVILGVSICDSLTSLEELNGWAIVACGVAARGAIIDGRSTSGALLPKVDVASSHSMSVVGASHGHRVTVDIAHIDRVPLVTRETRFDQAVALWKWLSDRYSSCPAGRECVGRSWGLANDCGLRVSIWLWAGVIGAEAQR